LNPGGLSIHSIALSDVATCLLQVTRRAMRLPVPLIHLEQVVELERVLVSLLLLVCFQ